MTGWSVVETEYSSEGRPEYEQIFVNGDSEAVENLNEVYLEERLNGFSFKDAAENLSNAQRNGKSRESSGDIIYPAITEDGYRWREEIIRSDGSWRKSIPFVDYQEIAVLFPQKRSGINPDDLDDGEIGLGALLVGQGYSAEEAQRIAKERKEATKEAVENNPYLRDTHFLGDRSVAVYATDNVETNGAEEFLWELADALEKETVDKQFGNK